MLRGVATADAGEHRRGADCEGAGAHEHVCASGAPLDKAIDIGAIVARVQLDRIRKLVDQGVAEGATCWQPQVTLPARGFYYPPTLLSNVHPTSIVAQQEIFGPVLAAMTFRTPREAVELANNTAYGLAACVWSESINVALHVAAQIEGRRGVGELHEYVRRGVRIWRLSRERIRTRGRARRAAGVSGAGVVQERAGAEGVLSSSSQLSEKT